MRPLYLCADNFNAIALAIGALRDWSAGEPSRWSIRRRLVRVHHPDADGNPDQFIRVKDAYEAATQEAGG